MTDGSTSRSTLSRDATGTSGGTTVTTARTRLVGARTGWSADALVTVVRLARAVGQAGTRAARAASSVVTPLGWTVIAVTPVLLAAGYVWGWTELVLAGAVGAAITIVAVGYLVGRIRLHFALEPPPVRVAVGDAAQARLVVTNPTSRRSFGTVVDLPVGERIVPIAVPGTGSGDRVALSVALPTDRRGRLTVGPVKTVRADPVGLVRREYHWADASEFIIHPTTIDVPSTSSGLFRDLEGQPTRDLTVSDLAFHALREYVPGDDRRHIHWKSSAKTGTFMVRQFEQTRRSRMLLALSIASVDFGSDAEFELAVSAAGSLGARAIRDARDVDVIVSEITPEFAKRAVVAVRPLPTLTPNRLLDELAVVEHGPAALGVVDVARLASSAVPGISVAILIVGSTVAPRRLRAAAAAFPASVEVLAVQCDPDTVPGRRTLGALTVLTVGSLSDLRRAIRGGELE
ncbi:DUF58 domain-containing protein [Microcella sp.]|uniref:DUF58 domain-containing protein n=1 Tax=Microcella sp. TaxID=1913979 RepID=UPI00391E0450